MMKEQLQSVAKDLLSSLADCLTANSAKELQAVVDSTEDHIDSVRATCCKSADAYWSGDAELNVRSNGSNIETDEATGDVYRTYTLGFSVNWSSFNDKVNADLMTKLHIMQKVATAAALLQEKYGQTYRVLYLTAAEVAERKVAAEKAALLNKVKTLAEHAVKGMRAGGSRREVSKVIFGDVPEGTYEVSYTNNYDTKKYTVKVMSWGVSLYRVS